MTPFLFGCWQRFFSILIKKYNGVYLNRRKHSHRKLASGLPILLNLELVMIHMKLLLRKNAVKCCNTHMVKPFSSL